MFCFRVMLTGRFKAVSHSDFHQQTCAQYQWVVWGRSVEILLILLWIPFHDGSECSWCCLRDSPPQSDSAFHGSQILKVYSVNSRVMCFGTGCFRGLLYFVGFIFNVHFTKVEKKFLIFRIFIASCYICVFNYLIT